MKTVRLVAGLVLLFPVLAFAETSVSDVKVAQRWPWNGLVDIELSVRQDEGKDVRLFVSCGSHQEERRRHNRRQDRVDAAGDNVVTDVNLTESK